MSFVKMCQQCANTHKDDFHNGFYEFIRDDINICPICNSKLIDTIITTDEYLVIVNISNDSSFIQAMINLKQKDPIEYQLKLNQFKLQQEQHEAIKEQERESSRPHCPYCNSTNIKKITGTERVASIAVMGIFSKKINKSFKCNNCGGTF